MDVKIEKTEEGYTITGTLSLSEPGEEPRHLNLNCFMPNNFLGSEQECRIMAQSKASLSINGMLRDWRLDLVTSLAEAIHTAVWSMHTGSGDCGHGVPVHLRCGACEDARGAGGDGSRGHGEAGGS